MIEQCPRCDCTSPKMNGYNGPPGWLASMAEHVWAAAFVFHLRHTGPGVGDALGSRIHREAVERAEWAVTLFLEAAEENWFTGRESKEEG